MVKTHVDESGLCRRVTLEARPRGGPLGLPYDPKVLEVFVMATQRLVLIHPHALVDSIRKVSDNSRICQFKAAFNSLKVSKFSGA